MNYTEATKLKIGDFVRIRNTHKEAKTNNAECIWVVIGIGNYQRLHKPMVTVELKLIKGTYVAWDKREQILNFGDTIKRTHFALELV